MSTYSRIEPRILKGFRDELPSEAEERADLFNKITSIFSLSGFGPIDTPALEYTEILLGKGSDETDKQLFRFEDQGGRDIALRFDLTVPLARYVSQHANDLIFPFRRYHIAPVWRAEKPQKGRYREFYQCDFDIIGSDSIAADIEILMLVHRIFRMINIPYMLRFNHRGLLNSLLQAFEVGSHTTEALRAIDKLEKQGRELVEKELIESAHLSPENAKALTSTVHRLQEETSSMEILRILEEVCDNTQDNFQKSLGRVKDILQSFTDAGIASENFKLDISIARGLDYYTGLVFETQVLDMPTIGSVCSGGRYDNLTSLFSSRELPGVGGSVGIDRLLVILRERYPSRKANFQAQVLVSMMDENLFGTYVGLANSLRDAGIRTELYPDFSKLGAQFKYADKKGIPFVIVMGSKEKENNTVEIKDLRAKDVSHGPEKGTSNQFSVPTDTLISMLQQLLNQE